MLFLNIVAWAKARVDVLRLLIIYQIFHYDIADDLSTVGVITGTLKNN